MSALKPSARAVLALLRSRGTDGLTQLEAIRALGCGRLAARIEELRAAGYPIRTEQVTNGRSRIARYVLADTALPVPTRGTQPGLGL